MKTTSKPNGSRVQRMKRRARAREAQVLALFRGREQAVNALVVHARDRAIHVHMPAGIRTARTLADRARNWVLNTAATLVARHIDRATMKVAFERHKLSFDEFVSAMRKGGQLTRLARG